MPLSVIAMPTKPRKPICILSIPPLADLQIASKLKLMFPTLWSSKIFIHIIKIIYSFGLVTSLREPDLKNKSENIPPFIMLTLACMPRNFQIKRVLHHRSNQLLMLSGWLKMLLVLFSIMMRLLELLNNTQQMIILGAYILRSIPQKRFMQSWLKKNLKSKQDSESKEVFECVRKQDKTTQHRCVQLMSSRGAKNSLQLPIILRPL